MPVTQITINMVSIILGLIVLILAVIIAFMFRLREVGYYIVIQTVLVTYSIIDLIYRRGNFFGWVLSGKTPLWFEHILYLFLFLSITCFELFFRYVLVKEKKPVFFIAAVFLSIAVFMLVISPYFIDPVSHVPIIGYYFYAVIFLLMSAVTFTDIIINHRKIEDRKLSYTALIFAIFLVVALGFQIADEINKYILDSHDKTLEFSAVQPALFLLWNTVVIVFANHYFTAKTTVFPEVKIKIPEIMDEFHLSERETEIIAHLCLGYSNREVGGHLFISDLTVKTHVRNIYQKLGVKNRLELLDKVSRFKD